MKVFLPVAFAGLLVLGAASVAASAAETAPDGATTFTDNCSACHQATGKGIPGAFPALDADPFVAGPGDVIAKTVLYGRGGMPAFAEELSDAQIAAAITYVRSSWSNHSAAVTTETVAAARSGAVAAEKTVLPGH
jgi:mono/diheme cytochrome c family protein